MPLKIIRIEYCRLCRWYCFSTPSKCLRFFVCETERGLRFKWKSKQESDDGLFSHFKANEKKTDMEFFYEQPYHFYCNAKILCHNTANLSVCKKSEVDKKDIEFLTANVHLHIIETISVQKNGMKVHTQHLIMNYTNWNTKRIKISSHKHVCIFIYTLHILLLSDDNHQCPTEIYSIHRIQG